MGSIPYLEGAVVQQQERNTLTCRIHRGGPVSVSFFGLAKLKPVASVTFVNPPGLKLADLLDLAATKMAVVPQRISLKDYLDVNAILKQTPITLVEALAAAKLFYGDQFNPVLTLKALAYFDDPDLAELPPAVTQFLIQAVRSVRLADVAAKVEVLRKTIA